MGRYGFILVFFVILAAPLVIHAVNKHSSGGSEPTGLRLVIITPDGQEIRNEFRWAFADWSKRKYGEPIELEFLTPGGTTDIRRQLDTIYRAIRDAHGGQLPPEDQVDTGIDMVWGGGDYEFNSKLKPLGILHPLEIDPKLMAAVFPHPTLAGVKLYDQEKDKSGRLLPPKWIGICLSSFGIIYNPDLYRAMQVPAPTTWTDLTDPRLFAALSLADPSHSGSAAMAYMMVIQRAMADAEIKFFALPENSGKSPAQLKSTPQYQSALDAGWKKGMGELLLIAANARYFNDSSAQSPNDVASGDAAGGIAIDFYGRVTEETVGSDRQRFVLPRGATAITPDPIAILYGTHGKQLELANRFIEFLLSEKGQRLWILKVGAPGGPRELVIRRSPIRSSVYADRTNWADDLNYFESAGGFNERGEWMGTFSELPVIWAAAWIDEGDALRDAARQILAVPDPARRASLLAELANIPITRGEVSGEIAEGQRVAADRSQDPDVWQARKRLLWARRFGDYYRAVGLEAEGAASMASEKP
jgi:iron(III) transport system substrate-binding protein